MKKIIKVLQKSLLVNVTLTLIKLIFGIIYKSKVLIADGIHSFSDLATDIVAIYGSGMADKPADDKHPYGHGKIEYLTSIIIGSVILALAISLIGASFDYHNTITSKMVLYITIFTILAKLLISTYIIKKGHDYKSNILIAAGQESKMDVLSSIVVVCTYLLSKLGTYNKIFLYSDSVGSFIIGLIILKTAYHVLRENITSILGEKELNEEYLNEISEIIKSNCEVKEIEELDIIKYGHYYQASITVSLADTTTIKNAHIIANKIKKSLINTKTRISYVKISIIPCMKE